MKRFLQRLFKFLAYLAAGVVILLAVAVFVPTFGQAQEFYQKWDSYQEQVTSLTKKGLASMKETFDTGIAEKYYDRGVTGYTWKAVPARV